MGSRPDEQSFIFSFVNMLKAGLRKQVLLRCPESGAWDSLSAVADAAVLVESDALRASLVDAPRGDANGGSSDQACYKCGQLGHRQAQCPSNYGGAGPSGHGGGGRHGGRPGRGGGRPGGSNMHITEGPAGW